jgi:DNA-directed RNA polymerase specialized sigma24 family protein
VSHTPKTLDPDSVYREHVHLVGRWVVRLGGPAVDVEDTVHEVFAIACTRLAGFRGDSSLATWLFGITDKVVRNRRRGQGRSRFGIGEGSDGLPRPAGQSGAFSLPLKHFVVPATATHFVLRYHVRSGTGDNDFTEGVEGTREGDLLRIRHFLSGKFWGVAIDARAAGVLVPATAPTH